MSHTTLRPSTSGVKAAGPSSGSGSADSSDLPYSQLLEQNCPRYIQYSDEFRQEYEDSYCESSDDCVDDDDDEDMDEDDLSEEDLDNGCPKYLIFSTGSKTYTPHQIGFKRVRSTNFPKKLEPGLSLKERIVAKERERRMQVSYRNCIILSLLRFNFPLTQNQTQRVEPDWRNFEAVSDRFEKIDKLIDLHGHIIGMALSPDHRYLYVNSRPWPKDYVISNALEPPPIAQEIDIHVIDLSTLKRVGNMLRSHKAYTPNTECFFIFLDVCDAYVARFGNDIIDLFSRFYCFTFVVVVLKICMRICGIDTMACAWLNINTVMVCCVKSIF